MKNYQVFVALFLFSAACHAAVEHFVESAASDGVDFDNLKVTPAKEKEKRMENLEFCWMNVTFQNQWQLCGCTLIDAQWVITSKTCVYE